MLSTPAEFPQAGSFCLYADPLTPFDLRRLELARVVMHVVRDPALGNDEATVRISMPLRDGSSATRTVPLADLVDATPLTKAEERELTDLKRTLPGKPATSKYARQYRRSKALEDRLCHAQLLDRERAALDRRNARSLRRIGGSPGAVIPTDARGVA